MGIAFQAPANHVNTLRAFLSRLLRTWTWPSAQEAAHAAESLAALEKALIDLDPSSFEIWAHANGYDTTPAVLPTGIRV